jgi:hypothetical protein
MRNFAMKKCIAISFLLLLLLLVSCGNVMSDREIQFEEGIFYDKNWSDTAGTYTGNAVESKETAVAIATAVYNGMHKSQSMSDLTPQSVYF